MKTVLWAFFLSFGGLQFFIRSFLFFRGSLQSPVAAAAAEAMLLLLLMVAALVGREPSTRAGCCWRVRSCPSIDALKSKKKLANGNEESMYEPTTYGN